MSNDSADSENPATELPFFTDLGLDGTVLAALNDLGYEKPTPIQARTIPVLLTGRDVVGLAQTGTGKTAAFALPALSRMAELAEVNGPDRSTQVLVLTPTRELAIQVAEAFSTYAQHLSDFTVLPVYGGSSYGPQLAGLRRGAQIVVGTPGRVIDHLERGSLNLSTLQYLVLDEADEMLRMGFAEDVERILSDTPEDKQVALFSATMPRTIRNIAQKYLSNPDEISVKAATSTGSNIRQRYVQVLPSHKQDAFTRLLETEDYDGVIVFVRTKVATEQLADRLKSLGFQAAAINGDIPQSLREKSVEALRAGRIDVLVATDVAARGLDVERISHVINYDIPHDTESYVHRIGRTGRAGRSGDAILLMTPRERYLLRAIEKATKGQVEQMHIPSVDQVNETRLGRFASKITEVLQEEDIEVYRSLVDRYVDTHEASAEDVAAALARLAQGGKPLLLDESDELPSAAEQRKPKRDGAGSRGPRRGPAAGAATYRIAVGHNDKVNPGSIVGAVANEAGISSENIGGIDIRATHTLIELPADLSAEQMSKLAKARVGRKPMKLELDTGRKTRAQRSDDDWEPRGPAREGRGGRGAGRGSGRGAGERGGRESGRGAGRGAGERDSRGGRDFRSDRGESGERRRPRDENTGFRAAKAAKKNVTQGKTGPAKDKVRKKPRTKKK